MQRTLALLGFLVVAGCAQTGPLSGGPASHPPPPSNAQASAPSPPPGPASHVSFIGDDPVEKRNIDDRGDRVVETLTLHDEAVISYERLKDGGFPGTYSDADALRVDMADPFFHDRGIPFERGRIHVSGPFTYLLQSTASYYCFLFHHNFGSGGRRGDQELRGEVCYPVTEKDSESLKKEILEILSRIRVDGTKVPTHVDDDN